MKATMGEIEGAAPDNMVLPVSSPEDDTLSADGTEETRGTVDLAPGRVFADRYEVQALLGRGGMGEVYRVHDRKLDEVVALKLLTLGTDRAVQRFLREVRLARRVTHPNVARTHDLGEHGGAHFLTMEYVRGTALDEVLDEHGKVPPARATQIAEQIATGLEAAHAAGVIHRDLKPANVLIGEDGRVVLTDFGIARAARTDTRTHETGALVGTPHYMAPEQVLGKKVDGRSDVYALGLILFELLTGALPFDDENLLAVAVKRVQEPPPDPRSLGDVPDALAELTLRCLAREPDARPQSAADLRTALAAFRSGTAEQVRLTTPSGASLFAPISPGRRTVAVLPFVYRGSADHDYLGEGLAEELIDVLSRTKGLRVLALGATRRFADERDPARIGSELGADAVVDGTVQLAGERVRIAARLVDSDSGVQRWSERFDGRFEDVFALQESMGRRVAESLRLQIDAAAHRRTAPQEAIELYLRARRHLRSDFVRRGEETVAMLDRCLELAPGFTPAYAAHALASVRAWWSQERDVGRQRGQRAKESVARAVERAPEEPDTQLVRAMLATQNGHYRESAVALAKALELAPTLADAHQYLGDLQVEAGRAREGAKRLRLALELDPSLSMCHVSLARLAALDGDWERAEEHLERLQDGTRLNVPVAMSRIRYALWRGDRDEARRTVDALETTGGDAAMRIVALGRVALGDIDPETVAGQLKEVEEWLSNPRFTSMMLQISAELFSAGGAHDIALDCVERAANGVLIDLEWMRRCPTLEPLRERDGFARALAQVDERASELWQR